VVNLEKHKIRVKEHLLACDQYLKNNLFDKARQEIQNAKNIDSSNVYISAFEERLKLFEEAYAKQHPDLIISNTPQPPSAINSNTVTQRKPELLLKPDIASQAESSHAPLKEEQLMTTINEMRKQIDELNNELKLERKAREEITRQELESVVPQLRAALEKVWQYGIPKNNETEEIKKLVQTFKIPPEVETSITREVKLKMYAKAVKEVIAKRKLLRSSSSALAWLRKIYQISTNEYLEYESNFLMDLVTSQFRGVMMFVTPDEKLREEFVPKFKETGFAVSLASSVEEAIEKVAKLNPVIVLCDTMSMHHGLSGFKFLHFWRTRSKHDTVPFILMCDPNETARIRASELKGPEGFITKICEFDEINMLVIEKLQHIQDYVGSIA
jgi:hypothetical protein